MTVACDPETAAGQQARGPTTAASCHSYSRPLRVFRQRRLRLRAKCETCASRDARARHPEQAWSGRPSIDGDFAARSRTRYSRRATRAIAQTSTSAALPETDRSLCTVHAARACGGFIRILFRCRTRAAAQRRIRRRARLEPSVFTGRAQIAKRVILERERAPLQTQETADQARACQPFDRLASKQRAHFRNEPPERLWGSCRRRTPIARLGSAESAQSKTGTRSTQLRCRRQSQPRY